MEEKPEVRKAGGVYYTPTYIVEYIVQNTVGKLLEGLTPKEAARLKILDPAYGSGTSPSAHFSIFWSGTRSITPRTTPRNMRRPKRPRSSRAGAASGC